MAVFHINATPVEYSQSGKIGKGNRMYSIKVPKGLFEKLSKKSLDEIQSALSSLTFVVKLTDRYLRGNVSTQTIGESTYYLNSGAMLVESDMIDPKDKELDELRKKVRELEDLKRSIATIKKSLGDV
jgi:hypothetical protein